MSTPSVKDLQLLVENAIRSESIDKEVVKRFDQGAGYPYSKEHSADKTVAAAQEEVDAIIRFAKVIGHHLDRGPETLAPFKWKVYLQKVGKSLSTLSHYVGQLSQD